MEISSGPSGQVQTEVLKKANEVQAQAVSTLLDESAKQLENQREQVQETQHQASTASLTGIGGNLDLRS